jgi:hypothetical protein
MKRVHISRVISWVGSALSMSAPNTEMWALLEEAAAGSMSNWGMKWTPPSSSPALLLPLLPVDGAMQSYRGEQQQCFSRLGWRAHISGVESKSYGAEVVNMVCTWVPYSASSVSRSASGTRFTPILRQNRSK